MNASYIGDDDGVDLWEITSSRGCCRFTWRMVEAKPIVEIADGCHDCINEINACALERGYGIERRPSRSRG